MKPTNKKIVTIKTLELGTTTLKILLQLQSFNTIYTYTVNWFPVASISNMNTFIG